MSTRDTLHEYYRLTKPGIVYGNTMVAGAAFFLGSQGYPDFLVFLALLTGIAAVMASACVFNNILDQDIDRKMKRTKNRALATGIISDIHALMYGTILLVIGLTILLFGTNALSTLVAIAGHIAYVILYGYAKRTTVHGTLVGTISGSTPPVIGYTAATGHLDLTALLLFLILVAWQMPHFYAIAIFRREEYAAANIPVLPVKKGLRATRRQIISYVVLFLIASISLWVWAGLSLLGTLIVVLAGMYWLILCLTPVDEDAVDSWARKQFFWSLKLLLILSVVWALDSFLH